MESIKGLGGFDLARLTQPRAQSMAESLEKTSKEPNASEIGKGGPKPEEAATQFEGLMLQEMLKSMWKGVPKGELLSGSNEEDMYRDMLNEAVAKSVSEGRSIGIRDVILRDINKLDKK